jgi:hypothetical protein
MLAAKRHQALGDNIFYQSALGIISSIGAPVTPLGFLIEVYTIMNKN